MKIYCLLFLAVGMLLAQTSKSMRDEFPRVFKNGEVIKQGDFEIIPHDVGDERRRGTDFLVTCRSALVNYAILEVFYIDDLYRDGKTIEVLLHHTVQTPTFKGISSLTDPVPTSILDIRMIRVVGLHKESEVDIR